MTYLRMVLATFVLFLMALVNHRAPTDIFDAWYEKRDAELQKRINEQI